MLDYPLFLGHFGTLGWGQEATARGKSRKIIDHALAADMLQ